MLLSLPVSKHTSVRLSEESKAPSSITSTLAGIFSFIKPEHANEYSPIRTSVPGRLTVSGYRVKKESFPTEVTPSLITICFISPS